MAKIYGSKSKYLTSNDNKLWIIGKFLIPLVVFIIYYCISQLIINLSVLKINIYIFLALIFLTIIGLKNFFNFAFKNQKLALKTSNKYHRGWKGEEQILNILKNLSDDYIIFYDVNLYDKGNIDFVLLGPCGLLVIEVKSHIGFIKYINNELTHNNLKFEKDFIKQTKKETIDLNKYLLEKINKNIFVTTVLCFSNKYSKLRFGFSQLDNCYVIKKEFLLELINKLPNTMSKDDINLIENEMSKLHS